MQIVLILALVATLFIAENAPASPLAGNVGVRVLLAALAMACVPGAAVAVAKITSRRLRRRTADPERVLASYRRLRRIQVAVWLAAVVGIAYGLGWAQIVRFNWHLDRVPFLDDLLILAPVLVPLVLSWAAFYEVDRATCHGPGVSMREYLDLHARHYLAIVLLPVVALLAVQDLVGLLLPEGPWRSDALLLAPIVGMVALLVVFPVLLRRVWRTRPLPAGELRTRLETMARLHGLRLAEILVWDTR
ncbi:MAG TPA: hypothetical protein VJL29_15770 [Thermoguttaceae bacterium]|nr:hypothetical protein [Thermoguttaceae bacterium]